MKERERFYLLLFLAAIVILVTLSLITAFFEPALTTAAVASSRNVVTTAINNSINKYVSDGSIDYSELVTLEKKEDGEISAITTDMVKINSLQTQITNDIIEEITSTDSVKLRIPIGNATGINIFYGRGPSIPYKIKSMPSVSAEFTNEFTSAGINQTKHQIMLNITVDISLLISGYTTETQVTTQVLVAETIIVGNVPDSYLNLDTSGGS